MEDTIVNVDASFTATWRAGANHTIILTHERVVTWVPEALPDILGQVLRLAHAPTHRQDRIFLSSYWVEQQKDANGDWHDSSINPYGVYELLLTRE